MANNNIDNVNNQGNNNNNTAGVGGDLEGVFNNLIDGYEAKQASITAQVQRLENADGLNPSAYLKMQMQMSRLSQISESISQYMSTVQSMLRNIISKFRPQ